MKLLSALDHSSRLQRRAPSTGFDAADLADLAARIERSDLASIDAATLAALAGRARLAGVHPEVAALLTDIEAPPVVRARAFGLVHRRLSATTPVGTDSALAVA